MIKKWSIVFLGIFAVASIIAVSCNDNEAVVVDSVQPEELDANLVKDPSAYDAAIAARKMAHGFKFSLDSVSRSGNILTVSVQGGCSAEDYQTFWNGAVQESYPMKVSLVLVLEHQSDACIMQYFDVKIDVSKILPASANPSDYVFEVLNGSIEQDKSLLPDGTVTSKP